MLSTSSALDEMLPTPLVLCPAACQIINLNPMDSPPRPPLPQVEPTAALRTLDMGPSADKADAARAFRAFWGEKAELRRFQDGAITEAVMWEGGGAAERHLVIDQIVTYILQRHLPAGTSVACHAGALDAALRRKHSSPEGDLQAGRMCEAAAERLR